MSYTLYSPGQSQEAGSSVPKGGDVVEPNIPGLQGQPKHIPGPDVSPGDNPEDPSATTPKKQVPSPEKVVPEKSKAADQSNDVSMAPTAPTAKEQQKQSPEAPTPLPGGGEKKGNAEVVKKNLVMKPVTGGSRMSGQTSSVLSGKEINEAEAEKRSLLKTNKMAVVVLALGLAVTAVLLMFVGCRLRMVKRRLRRGRPLNSNEADYLINGMYL